MLFIRWILKLFMEIQIQLWSTPIAPIWKKCLNWETRWDNFIKLYVSPAFVNCVWFLHIRVLLKMIINLVPLILYPLFYFNFYSSYLLWGQKSKEFGFSISNRYVLPLENSLGLVSLRCDHISSYHIVIHKEKYVSSYIQMYFIQW